MAGERRDDGRRRDNSGGGGTDRTSGDCTDRNPGDCTDRTADDPPLLTVEELETRFPTDGAPVRAVDGVSLSLARGETLGLVGESGAGKTAAVRSILGLVSDPGRVVGGRIAYRDSALVARFADQYPARTADVSAGEAVDDGDFVVIESRSGGRVGERGVEEGRVEEGRADRGGADRGYVDGGYVDLAAAPERALRDVRGGEIAMVFQNAAASLNPVYTVGAQIEEALERHRGLRGAAARDAAVDLLSVVGLPDAPRRADDYPHELSGGMCQRVAIAIALACDPAVLLCDEPTTGLDVTVQAQLLDLLADLQAERDLAVLFVTHDMGVVAEVCDRVAVAYAGEIVERAGVEALFEAPKHPYTRALLDCVPGRTPRGERLPTIAGEVPTPTEPATACRFAPRCPEAVEACERVHPDAVDAREGGAAHDVRCLLYAEDAGATTPLPEGDTE